MGLVTRGFTLHWGDYRLLGQSYGWHAHIWGGRLGAPISLFINLPGAYLLYAIHDIQPCIRKEGCVIPYFSSPTNYRSWFSWADQSQGRFSYRGMKSSLQIDSQKGGVDGEDGSGHSKYSLLFAITRLLTIFTKNNSEKKIHHTGDTYV